MILEITHSNNCEELVDISFACFDRPNRKAEFLITDRHQVSMLRLQPRRSNDVSNDVWIYDAENVTRDGHVLRGNLSGFDSFQKKHESRFVLYAGNAFCMSPRLHTVENRYYKT